MQFYQAKGKDVKQIKSIYISLNLLEEAKEFSKRLNLHFSQFVIIAIEFYIEKLKRDDEL